MRHFGLGHLVNDFSRSCGDEEEDETSSLRHRRKRHLGAYYMENLDELSPQILAV